MFEIEGQRLNAEQAIAVPPSPRVRKRRADQSSGVGQNCRAEQAKATPPASLDTNQPAEGQKTVAEQAIPCTPSPVDTIIKTLIALQKERRFLIKTQSRIDRSLEAFLAQQAGYRPKVAPDGTRILDAEGKPVQDKEGKKLWAEIGRVRRMVEAGTGSEAKAPERAGQASIAEQASHDAPARKPSRKGSREGHSGTAEQASPVAPSLPHWANAPLILASAQSRAVWDNMRDDIEAQMETLAKQLPIWPWWRDNAKGGGAKWLAVIVGEAGDVGSYRDKSALWKRCGVAVIDGERQRKKSSVEAAAAHGYSPKRRSEIWNVAEGVVRAQWRGERDEDGNKPSLSKKPVAVEGHAIGRYGDYYARRKTYLAERERGVNEREPWPPKHIDADARRYMTKALLRDLRAAWRAAEVSSTPDATV